MDVALAVNADGVHLGPSDMSVEMARKLLPPGYIIGVSCNTVEDVKQAVHDRVDYIGIGAVWSTQTKNLTSPIVGVRGIGSMLEVLDGTDIKAVAIGKSRNECDPIIPKAVFKLNCRRNQGRKLVAYFTWSGVVHIPRS